METGIMNDHMMPSFPQRYCVVGPDKTRYSPSTSWSLAGPIIERSRITIAAIGKNDREWFAEIEGAELDTGVEVGYGKCQAQGSTALIAAMRAFVKSRIGDEAPD
jgi:hypothetical protein